MAISIGYLALDRTIVLVDEAGQVIYTPPVFFEAEDVDGYAVQVEDVNVAWPLA